METVALQGKDFSTIHNALCELRTMSDYCSDEVAAKINPIINKFEQGLKDAYRQENEAFDRKFDLYKNISNGQGFKHSIWSIYSVDNFDTNSSVPEGSKIRSWYSGKDVHVTVKGSSWLDLWKATEQLMEQTLDEHGDHVFIEGFSKVKNEDGVYEVILGS
jgi:hypothetical protein